MMITLYPVNWDGCEKRIAFVAFDRQAAEQFIATEQREWENENEEYIEACGGGELPYWIDEVPLVDNYGFPCVRADAAFVVPWLAEASA